MAFYKTEKHYFQRKHRFSSLFCTVSKENTILQTCFALFPKEIGFCKNVLYKSRNEIEFLIFKLDKNMKELIKSTSLNKAHIMDFAEVMSIVASFLEKEDLDALKLTQIANEFTQQLEALDKGLVQARKTGLTEKIVATDNQRDSLFVGFRSVLNGMLHFPDQNVAEMAEQIKIVVDKYGKNIPRLPQREETSVLTNLIDDLQADENKEKVNSLNLTPWVVAMQKANNEFEKLYTERTEKSSKIVIALAKEEREKMQEAFTSLCQTINAYGIIEGEEAYKSLANKINEEVSNVKQRYK